MKGRYLKELPALVALLQMRKSRLENSARHPRVQQASAIVETACLGKRHLSRSKTSARGNGESD